MESRANRFVRLCQLIGEDIISVVDANNGWPGLVRSESRPDNRLITLHVSSVGSHARKEYELRFQNPGQDRPVISRYESHSLLLGDAGDILILVDGTSRLGRNTRFSILFSTTLVEEAREKGWSVYTSTSGETIYAFKPVFFDAAVSHIIDGSQSFEPREITNIHDASGYADEENKEARERVRRNVSSIVRNGAFSGNVRKAYKNKCAMCGINCSVVVGAHVYPASAPASADIVINGLALCQNHHTIFDNHQIWVHPESREVYFHPEIIEEARNSKITQHFIDTTFKELVEPQSENSKPLNEMFEKRYLHYNGRYDWVATEENKYQL